MGAGLGEGCRAMGMGVVLVLVGEQVPFGGPLCHALGVCCSPTWSDDMLTVLLMCAFGGMQCCAVCELCVHASTKQ